MFLGFHMHALLPDILVLQLYHLAPTVNERVSSTIVPFRWSIASSCCASHCLMCSSNAAHWLLDSCSSLVRRSFFSCSRWNRDRVRHVLQAGSRLQSSRDGLQLSDLLHHSLRFDLPCLLGVRHLPFLRLKRAPLHHGRGATQRGVLFPQRGCILPTL